MVKNSKRPYDARRRRERAADERQLTRRRVADAARRLFLERGYVATTMADVATEAGVALQSVYNVGQSKADLLHLVTDVAVAGDDQDVMLIERPEIAAVATEPDPERQLEMVATGVATALERLAPVWICYREAAAVDPKAAANLENAQRRRHESLAAIVAMLPEDRLRRSQEETADTMWAIASIDLFLLLRSIRGWDATQFADWLSRTLVDQLLTAE
jgi:AcrR family transcriptional regulator